MPLVVVAVLVATTLMAAALKLARRTGYARACRGGGREPRPPQAAATPRTGLGAGAPPTADEEDRRGARMLHGDARHTGRAGGPGPPQPPGVAWSRDVGGPVEAQIVASPDEQTLYVASLGGTLTALARDDGSVTVGSAARRPRPTRRPAWPTTGQSTSGATRGSFSPSRPRAKSSGPSRPTAKPMTRRRDSKDGTVVVAAGRMVYALTPLGYVKWRFAAKRKVFSSPAVSDDGRVFFGSQDHHAYARFAAGKARLERGPRGRRRRVAGRLATTAASSSAPTATRSSGSTPTTATSGGERRSGATCAGR